MSKVFSENIQEIKTAKNKMLPYIFAILSAILMLSNSALIQNEIASLFLRICRYIAYIVFCLNIIFDTFVDGKKPTILAIIFFVVSFLVFIISKNKVLLILFVVLYSLSNFSDLDEIAKKSFWTMVVTFFAIILLTALKVIPNWIYGENSVRVRYSLGFVYPTITLTFFMFVILLRSYVKKLKLSYIEIILYLLISGILFYYTDSRTGFILILFILIANLINIFFVKNKDRKINNVVKWILILLPIFAIIIYGLLTYFYYLDFGFAIKVNDWLSGRLHLTVKAFNEFPITLFGYPLKLNGWGGYSYIIPVVENYDYNYLDNDFCSILFTDGIIALALVVFVYSLMSYKAIKEKNIAFLFCYVIILINASIEPNLLNYGINIFVLYFSSYLSKIQFCFLKSKIEEKKSMEKVE